MRLIAVFIILLFSVPAFSADYYVSPSGSGTTCSQASPCSISSYSPFNNAVAGDTWHFSGGNYYMPPSVSYESAPSDYQVSNSGTPGNEIIFKAIDGETPVLVGDRGQSNQMVVMLEVYNQHDIIIDGFTFEAYDDTNGGGAARVPEIMLYTSTDYDMNVVVQNCTFNGAEVTISDNHHMIWIAGPAGGYGSGITIQNNVFNDMYGYDLAPANGNGISVIMPYGYDGATDPNQSHDVIIKNNVFNNVGTGLYFKGNQNPAHDYSIYNNFFNGVETAVAYGTNGPDNIDFYNNIVILKRVSGSTTRVLAAVSADSYQYTAENNTVYSNTIYSTDSASNAQTGVFGHAASIDIYNNIFQLGIQGSGEQSGALYFYADSGIQWLNHNNFSSSFRVYAEANAYTSIASLEASSILTTSSNPCSSTSPCNNISSDSVFVNTSGNMNTVADFALDVSSPGYGTGYLGVDIGADVSLVGVDAGASNITCYKDVDGDLYSDGTSESVEVCSSDYYEAGDLTAVSGDCDDTNALVNPGVVEAECDADVIDNDCSGADAPTCTTSASYTLGGCTF